MLRLQLVSMLYADGQTTSQIAAQLGCTPMTVVTYVKRAKQRYIRAGRARPFALDKLALRRLLIEDGLLKKEEPCAGGISSSAR